MKIPFIKMEGCGNDYIYVDGTSITIPDLPKAARMMSDRHFGIGADGLIVICGSDVADYRMRMFNADGSEGRMCGNGIRCMAKYLHDRGMVKGLEVSIETLSGIKFVDMFLGADGAVARARVDMGKPSFEAADIPTALEPPFGGRLAVCGGEYTLYCVSMGNPHAVVFVDDPKKFDVHGVGAALESHPVFPERCNIEFVRVHSRNSIDMRVWERGSGETLACGTGACAAAVASMKLGLIDARTDVHLPGGTLTIEWQPGSSVFLTGPAKNVFTGEVDIDFSASSH